MTASKNTPKSHRGFAAMDQAQQREIASKGGKAAHLKGTAHEFTSEEAREAGRKGGAVSRHHHHHAVGPNQLMANNPLNESEVENYPYIF